MVSFRSAIAYISLRMNLFGPAADPRDGWNAWTIAVHASGRRGMSDVRGIRRVMMASHDGERTVRTRLHPRPPRPNVLDRPDGQWHAGNALALGTSDGRCKREHVSPPYNSPLQASWL